MYFTSASFVGFSGETAFDPYSTVDEPITVSPSSSINVTVYFLYVSVYVAVYVSFPSTFLTALSQPANAYVYVLSSALLGFDGTVTTSP